MFDKIYSIQILYRYRGSPDSTDIGAKLNRTIVKTALIGDWFSTKTEKWDKSNFKVHYLVRIWYRTKPGTALIETILTGDPLYNKNKIMIKSR